MGKAFGWTCPYCQRAATITNSDVGEIEKAFANETRHDQRGFSLRMIVCPNPECKEYSVSVDEFDTAFPGAYLANVGDPVRSWLLKPESMARPTPSYVPVSIASDYREACLVRNLSPKASATLSRRCLQGMIRDFHKVKPGNLFNEIDEIKDKIDATTWAAIDAVRKVGNIGAHMEKDVDIIVDVEPEEAQLLIGLIETLIKEWYITRHERDAAMAKLVQLAANKDAAKKGPPSP
jgi:hypothetical protein